MANAHDLSQYIALSYFGVPGLTIGGAISSGKAVSVPAPPNAPIAGSQRVTLWEGHVRWTPDKFDLPALVELDVVDRNGLLLGAPLTMPVFASFSAPCFLNANLRGCEGVVPPPDTVDLMKSWGLTPANGN